MAHLELVLLDDVYFLRANGRESDAYPYGEPLDCTLEGQRYVALVDVRGRTSEVESVLPEWVYAVSGSIPDVQIVEDEDDEEEAEETEEDELEEPEREKTIAEK